MRSAEGRSAPGVSLTWALTVACLLALFAQLVLAIPHLSVTYDEPIYTGIGLADLTTGNFYWHGVIGHGPLANMLTAWPLLLGPRVPDVTQTAAWGTHSSLGLGREVMAALGPLETTLFVTRLPITWLTLLLAAIVTRWTRRAWGRTTGLLALALFTFEPNIIAHGQLNTTDMSVTFFGFLSIYLLSCYLRRPRIVSYVGAGFAVGAAIASKASGLFWVGAHGLILFAYWVTTARKQEGAVAWSLVRWGVRGAGIVTLATLGLWAAYGFEIGPLTHGGLPVPAPSHWVAFAYLSDYLAEGQTTFITGELYTGGHWRYFPTTLLLKTPVPLLLGACLGLIVAVRRGLGRPWDALPFALTPLAYFGFSMRSGLNIGHRHLLPILPYLVMLAAQTGRWWRSGTSRSFAVLRERHGHPMQRALIGMRIIVPGALALLSLIETVGVFPRYLSYFNLLAGGPEGGYRYLADSSTDWGQGFYDLKAYLDDQDDSISPTYLSSFSSIDPSLYGLKFDPLPPTENAAPFLPSRFAPVPGRYIISVVPLQGVWLLDPDTYDWFRRQEPVARVSHIFNVYEVPPITAPARRLLQCADPVPPLDQAALDDGFGHALGPNTVLSTFNCTRGWIYPGSDSLLILRSHHREEPWVAKRTAGLAVRFSQREHWSHPAITIYDLDEQHSGAQPPETEVHLLPASWVPGQSLQGSAVSGPIATSGPLDFLGYDLANERDTVTLSTFWQVMRVPDRPLSLMAHLVDAQGVTVAVADGLDVAVESWQAGDLLVQRHVFEGVETAGSSHYLLSGAYWLDTMARWDVDCGSACTTSFWVIPTPVQ